MNVVVVGGTGLLGQHSARSLLRRGHRVTLLSRRQPHTLLSGLEAATVHIVDLDFADDAALREALTGFDAAIYALGPDDRTAHPAPSDRFFRRYLVERTARVATAARSAGVSRFVILGSYFTAWDRMHPEAMLRTHHTYVEARFTQAQRAVEIGGGQAAGGMDVCVVEIPYVFGAVPGTRNQWSLLFGSIRSMRGFVPTLGGGTSAISAAAAGDAIAAATISGRHDGRYPIKQSDLTWTELMSAIADRVGVTAHPIPIPKAVLQLGIVGWGALRAVRRVGTGLAPARILPDILAQHLYVDDSRAELDYAGPAVDAGIAESASA